MGEIAITADGADVPQPVQRRALEVIGLQDRIWMIGGLTPEGAISPPIHLFDPKTETWSSGPDVPGMAANGNGIEAAVAGGSLVLAGMDGKVYRLADDAEGWTESARLPTSRIHHRQIGDADRRLVIAGASRTGHLKSAEFVALQDGKQSHQFSTDSDSARGFGTQWNEHQGKNFVSHKNTSFERHSVVSGSRRHVCRQHG